MWCILISLFILTSYVIAVCIRWGIPDSLSQTFFDIKRKWIFSSVVAVSAVLLYFSMMNILSDAWQWLAFIFLAGCLFIAFAPNLADDMEKRVHMTGATLLALASQGIVAVLNPLILGLWIAWLVFTPLKERVFFAEMIGGACLYAALLL